MAELRDQLKKINIIKIFKGPVQIFKNIYGGDIALEDVEKDQKNSKQS